MNRTLLLACILAAAPLAGCGGDDDHAHGPDTHTHDEAPDAPATPSTTYLDTTGVAPDTTGFFDEAEAEAAEAGAHTHDDGTTHEH